MMENKSREELLEELQGLRRRIKELESVRPISHDEKLLLDIIDRAPFTIWACNRDFIIKLWNKKCEENYGYRASEAIGKSFVELFVSEPEREQSRIDCLAIIDEDTVFENFLAWDKSRGNKDRVMLTNCFRIYDEGLKEFLQAEVGLEISDLELRTRDHRNLREVGIARLAEEKQTLETCRTEMGSRLNLAYKYRSRLMNDKQGNLIDWETHLRRGKATPAEIGNLVNTPKEKLGIDKAKLAKDYESLKSNIEKAQTMDDLNVIRTELENFEVDTND